jgi:hypothetical protein
MHAQSGLPTPTELIRRAIAAEQAQAERGRKYTFREDHIQSQIDKNGNPGPPKTDTYEHIMLEGSNYRKLILSGGKPLDAKTQKKVDEDLEKARTERRSLLSFKRTVSLGGMELVDRLFDNKVTGEEIIAGRKTWRMESEPKPGYKSGNAAEDEALATRRVYWFDEEDGVVIQDHSVFIRAAKGFQPGSTIDTVLAPIGDDWMLSEGTMRADMKFMPGVRGRVESHQKYYDYRRFTVDSAMKPE